MMTKRTASTSRRGFRSTLTGGSGSDYSRADRIAHLQGATAHVTVSQFAAYGVPASPDRPNLTGTACRPVTGCNATNEHGSNQRAPTGDRGTESNASQGLPQG